MRIDSLALSVVVGSCLGSTCLAQESPPEINLLAGFNPKSNAVAGQWTTQSDGVRVRPGRGARAVLKIAAPENYRVEIEFTRLTGDDTVALILPIAATSAALEISSWNGEAHGLARVDEQTSKSPDNPTSARPGRLTNGERHKLSVLVTCDGSQCAIVAQLDGQKIIEWNGKADRIQPHFAFNLQDRRAIGVGASQSDVIFHKATLAAAKVTAPQPNPSSGKGGTLEALVAESTPGWEPFNSARFTEAASKETGVVASIPSSGSGDRGAFVKKLEFATGVIDIDLKGDSRPQQSFLGVVFHGIDGETYESVYFRPFNFGSSDSTRRSHAVQYISHPNWPWQRLRDERIGQFEKAVQPEPKPDEWFHARIEVTDVTVRAFVNDSEVPSLDVKRLTKRTSGKVGLWFNGIASYRNFKVTQLSN